MFSGIIVARFLIKSNRFSYSFSAYFTYKGTKSMHKPIDKFNVINEEIRKVVEGKGSKYIKVPYTTRIWIAQAK